jgi:hypothetical protein
MSLRRILIRVIPFHESLLLLHTTMEMGDVPCSDAIKGESNGVFSPKYDPQEDVFVDILSD